MGGRKERLLFLPRATEPFDVFSKRPVTAVATRSFEMPESGSAYSFSRGGIALLGITERRIKASRRHILTNFKPRKSFPMPVKTLGDHIQFKRVEKGFTYAELALKSKVTKSKVLLWEKDSKLPNEIVMASAGKPPGS